MRVLLVTGEYPAMQGGVGDYSRRLGQALGALGVEVHVLTDVDAGGDHLRAPDAPFEPSVRASLDKPGWPLWGQTLRAVAELQPQVVHIQYQSAAFDLHPAVNLLPYRLRLSRLPIRVVTTFHDLRVPYLFPKAGRLRWRAVMMLAETSDALILTNPVDWLRLSNSAVAPRMHAIPIGSNIQCQPPASYDRQEYRRRWGVGPDDWLLAYFGFLNASKGAETLVYALDQLAQAGKPAHLLMVGGQVGSSDPTNWAYLEQVRTLIKTLNLDDRVGWTGFVDTTEVTANLLAADCAVLPYREGASLRHGSLMAALAHGMAIVTTKPAPSVRGVHGLFPMLENRESALLVAPDDPLQVAAAVTELMGDAALRARIAAGSEKLSAEFQWDSIAHQHQRVYDALTGG